MGSRLTIITAGSIGAGYYLVINAGGQLWTSYGFQLNVNLSGGKWPDSPTAVTVTSPFLKIVMTL